MKKNYILATVLIISVLLTSLLGAPTNVSAASLNNVALQDITVPLHQSQIGATNPGFTQASCPTPPAGQEGWWGWHFVMPNNNNFTSLSVTFQNAGTFSANPFPGVFVAHPDNSHAYIWTPGPDTLLGGSATSDGDNEFFNLSHVCPGGIDTETPTPTPTDPPTETPTPTNTPTETPTPTNTPTETPTSELGQLKLCKLTGPDVIKGDIFTFSVNNTPYNVAAGYCVLAGQYPLNTKVTIRENVPTGYFVASISVLPGTSAVSMNTAGGEVVVKIAAGITEVTYKNATSTSTSTKTPEPTTPPEGYMQICKQASGDGVSGYFMFRFDAQSRSVPVGSCSSLIYIATAGTLTVTEDAQAGYQVADIYTIPADRLVSKDLNARTATVNIVQGDVSSQTVVVFVNRKIELGQLKLCKLTGNGVIKGDMFSFSVNNTEYNVAAGYCVLAGQYPLNTQVTIRENIPTGYFVESISVLPGSSAVSTNTAGGETIVKIGSGVTEVTYKNAITTSTSTKTPAPTTPPDGYMQICKQAAGSGVSGYFTFSFGTQTRSVPVGSCTGLIYMATAGNVTITEGAQTGYQVADIYTIPADRLVSKDLNARTATVSIVPGDVSSQTIVVFVNRAVTTPKLITQKSSNKR